MPQERLQKLISQAGIASRRASEELITQGRVTINGQVAKVGDKADPAIDLIRVDGELLKLHGAPKIYLMLNKPTGVVSAVTAQRQEKRRTVLDLVQADERVYPVGRLDADSEGLILLTNDGSLTQRLTHPRYGHMKTYRVLVYGHPEPTQLELWAAGVLLDDGPTLPCEVHIVEKLDEFTWLEVKMREGRKRQIRRTAGKVGLRVKRLVRVQIGPLKLGTLKPGEWRALTEEEVRALKASRPAPGGKRAGTGPAAARLKGGAPGRGKPGARPGSGKSSGGKPSGGGRGRKPGGARSTGDSADSGPSSGRKPARKPTGGKPGGPRSTDDSTESGPSSRQKPSRKPTGDSSESGPPSRQKPGRKPTGGKPGGTRPIDDSPESGPPSRQKPGRKPTGGKPGGGSRPSGRPGSSSRKPGPTAGRKPGQRKDRRNTDS